MKKRDIDYTIIIGCGRLGATIANALANENRNVLIIDRNEDAFNKLGTSFAGQEYVGNAAKYDVLDEISMKDATAVIVVTHEDNMNIMLSQMIKERYGINRIIARLYDPERDAVYKELGIKTLYPAYLEAEKLLKWYNDEEDDEYED